MKNQDKIDRIEIMSFMKEWLRNTNEEIVFIDTKIEQKKMVYFYQELLSSFLKNRRKIKIYGVDKMDGFEINLSDEKSYLKICQDIWDHPENYYKLKDKDANYYYDFLKYLWVTDKFDNEKRLVDIVNTDIKQEN